MRRPMINTREDAYASRRDYQELTECASRRLWLPGDGSDEVRLRFGELLDGPSTYMAVGAYLRADEGFRGKLRLLDGDAIVMEREIAVDPVWSRFGAAIETRGATERFSAELSWPAGRSVDVWGLAAGRAQLPEVIEAIGPTPTELNATHIVPETYYFEHDEAWTVEMLDPAATLEHGAGAPLMQKKCSFDSRFLPVDPDHPGRLAFHRHAAKRTNHHNECRSCKKWRINRLLNGVRTSTQHNEAGLLSRERKILLREPQILEVFKESHGRGLKDYIWEKFDRRCFRCKRELDSPSAMDLDHTRPLAYLWPIDEHATCLCPECNNQKRDRFPIDFYTADERRALAEATGLSLAEIENRAINPEQLERILEDLPTFAAVWDPRLFSATARRIKELEPEIDLFEELITQNPDVAEDLEARLREVPSVGGEDE